MATTTKSAKKQRQQPARARVMIRALGPATTPLRVQGAIVEFVKPGHHATFTPGPSHWLLMALALGFALAAVVLTFLWRV